MNQRVLASAHSLQSIWLHRTSRRFAGENYRQLKMIRELSEKEALELLSEQKNGHLGCVLSGGQPYVVPVNYLFHDDKIYIHSLPGDKIDALRANGKICLQVEKIEDSYQWKSAIAFGDFREVKKTNEIIRIMQAFSEKFPRLTPVEAMIEEGWNAGGIVLFRIKTRRITGIEER